ncbi:PREDICTED: putative F-box protein At1g20795 [Camelina sativa]|uniref:F-box protein At1g20795 n=1 Tax=Camelina sativa TaxID=90675 RepID=A0ABM0SKY1_CAMSA|nr:PREDICTED: putative F-box protein At1g20795 [Camelina sativa]
MKKPVYLDGSLHWLRTDGSIVAFNPETEHARLILTKFPQELSLKTLFAADDNNLTLISETEGVVNVYALENTLIDPKWVLVRQFRYGVLDEQRLIRWKVAAYDGKCLVLEFCKVYNDNRVVHGYDLRTNKWLFMGSIPGSCDATLDYFLFTPPSSTITVE